MVFLISFQFYDNVRTLNSDRMKTLFKQMNKNKLDR